MKEFLHNGEKVIYQTVQDERFLDLLNKAGIIPEELPEDNMSYRVFKYTKDGVKRYACVMVANAPDTYIEKIFITYAFPEDGFENLMLDIVGQKQGDNEKIIRSRLSVANAKAESSALEWIKKEYPEQYNNYILYGEFPEEIQKEYNNMYKLSMNYFGYHIEDLEKISAPDCDMDYMKNVLK